MKRLAVLGGAWWLVGWGVDAALPALARLLNPYGFNAGFAVNAIMVASGAIALWWLHRLLVRRLADAGWRTRLALVPVVALVAAALLSDHIFLWSRHFGAPEGVTEALVLVALAVAGSVLTVALVLPGARRAGEPSP